MSTRRTLTRLDWVAAGQELLRSGGIGAVRLSALTSELGVTTGSFYHHFADMASYLGALADYYGHEQVADALELVAEDDPLDRLAHLAQLAVDRRMRRLDWAMRVWGASDERAARALERSDATLLEFVEQAFGDLGFTTVEARARALLLFSAAVVPVHRPWTEPDPGFADLLTALVGDRSRPIRGAPG